MSIQNKYANSFCSSEAVYSNATQLMLIKPLSLTLKAFFNGLLCYLESWTFRGSAVRVLICFLFVFLSLCRAAYSFVCKLTNLIIYQVNSSVIVPDHSLFYVLHNVVSVTNRSAMKPRQRRLLHVKLVTCRHKRNFHSSCWVILSTNGARKLNKCLPY